MKPFSAFDHEFPYRLLSMGHHSFSWNGAPVKVSFKQVLDFLTAMNHDEETHHVHTAMK
jgi:hypothetical protein